MLQRTIAAITQPSHGWKSTRRMASQIPNAIAPSSPKIVAPVATIPTLCRFSVAAGVSAVRERDDDDPRHHERAHERRRKQQVNREDPVFERHAKPEPVLIRNSLVDRAAMSASAGDSAEDDRFAMGSPPHSSHVAAACVPRFNGGVVRPCCRTARAGLGRAASGRPPADLQEPPGGLQRLLDVPPLISLVDELVLRPARG